MKGMLHKVQLILL